MKTPDTDRLRRQAQGFRRLETFWRAMATECGCHLARKTAREHARRSNRFARQIEARLLQAERTVTR